MLTVFGSQGYIRDRVGVFLRFPVSELLRGVGRLFLRFYKTVHDA